jgi:hypothetical protein
VNQEITKSRKQKGLYVNCANRREQGGPGILPQKTQRAQKKLATDGADKMASREREGGKSFNNQETKGIAECGFRIADNIRAEKMKGESGKYCKTRKPFFGLNRGNVLFSILSNGLGNVFQEVEQFAA